MFKRKPAGGAAGNVRAMHGTPIQFASLNDPALAEMLRGGSMSAAGAVVNADTAMCVAAFWRCVSIIANSIASLPLHLMEEDARDSRIKRKAVNHPLFDVLYFSPNGWQTSYDFRNTMLVNLLVFGNAYAYKVMGADGNVRQLVPIRADAIEVKQLDDFSLEYTHRKPDGSMRKYQQSDVFHLREMSAGGIVGESRLSKMRNALGLSIQTEVFASVLFANGANPGSVFKHPGVLSAEAYERLKESINEHVGAGNSHKPIILEEGMDQKPAGMTNQDSQFIDVRRYQISDIAMFFGVPPHMLGDSKATTSWGTGIEQQNIGYLTFTVGPLIASFEQAIIRDLIMPRDRGRVYPKFNVSGLLRSSSADQAAYFSAALGSGGSPGWRTPNEIRELIDVGPIDGGDVLPNAGQAPAPSARLNLVG